MRAILGQERPWALHSLGSLVVLADGGAVDVSVAPSICRRQSPSYTSDRPPASSMRLGIHSIASALAGMAT